MSHPVSRSLLLPAPQLPRRIRRLLLAAVLIVTIIVGAASPASAHTSLVESIPGNRSSLSTPPSEVTLVFAEAVDPRSVQLDIIGLDGVSIPGAELITSDAADAATIKFKVPELEPGVYGFPWVTVGPDGHRVAGEVVVGIGVIDDSALAAASFASTPLLDRSLQVINGVARFIWYIGLSLMAGALFVTWALRNEIDADATGMSSKDRAARALGGARRRSHQWLTRGWNLLLVGQVLRSIATLWLVTRGYGDSFAENLSAALNSQTGITAVLGLVVVFLMSLVLPLVHSAKSAPQINTSTLAGAAGLVSVIGLAEANSHTAVLSENALGILTAILHVAGAVIWFGPLAIIVVAVAASQKGLVSKAQHDAVVIPLYGYLAPWAFASFLVLVASGVRATWIATGWDLLATGYGQALIVKLVLIAAVIVPLGLYHDRRVGLLATKIDPATDGPAPEPPAPVFARIETGAMLAVFAIAALVTGLNPVASTVASGDGTVVVAGPGADLLSTEAVDHIDECLTRTVGQANCYRDYFKVIMERFGATEAVAQVDAAQIGHEFVRRDCHQVVHDLGNDAAVFYGDIGIALSYEGSACWSGYYHGIIEFALSQYDNEQLLDEVAGVCDVAAEVPYSFTHYNCLHGVGHGVMLRLNSDLFASFPYCERYTDEWELRSCVSGAFMENVVSGQQVQLLNTEGIYSDSEPTLSETDLMFPCTALDKYLEDCYNMQTSWVLWNNGRDYADGFTRCDGVQSDYVPVCYRSMGRDISGDSLVDPDTIVNLCTLGQPELHIECYIGGMLNAIFNYNDTAVATVICDMLPAEHTETCYANRDAAAATLTS